MSHDILKILAGAFLGVGTGLALIGIVGIIGAGVMRVIEWNKSRPKRRPGARIIPFPVERLRVVAEPPPPMWTESWIVNSLDASYKALKSKGYKVQRDAFFRVWTKEGLPPDEFTAWANAREWG